MHVLVIGNHPLQDSIVRQCRHRGDDVTIQPSFVDGVSVDGYDEVFVLSGKQDGEDAFEADQRQIAMLEHCASQYVPRHHDGRRQRCHIMLRSSLMLQMLRTNQLGERIGQVIDVYPFMLEEEWSRCLQFDREPVTIHSEKTVHLVVVGWGDFAERLVVNAAHVAHYPNYIRNNRLRTRITVLHEGDMREFIGRYRTLLESSYYRTIGGDFKEYELHTPDTSVNGEITDIEWEFVNASIYNEVVEAKIKHWSLLRDKQILTVAIAHDDNDERNMREALYVAQLTEGSDSRIYVRMKSAQLFGNIDDGVAMPRIVPVGMLDEGYDINNPLVDMAKTVNAVYHDLRRDATTTGGAVSLRDLTYVVQIDNDERSQAWEGLSLTNRMSSVYHAMSIPTKMRSVGIRESEWGNFYDLSMQDIEVMAKVEHNRWCTTELLMGFRPCTQDERAAVANDIQQKEVLKQKHIHYDLCSYDMLGIDANGVHVTEYDRRLCASMPLIVKSSASEYEKST